MFAAATTAMLLMENDDPWYGASTVLYYCRLPTSLQCAVIVIVLVIIFEYLLLFHGWLVGQQVSRSVRFDIIVCHFVVSVYVIIPFLSLSLSLSASTVVVAVASSCSR